MYLAHFDLDQRPFSITPDPRFVYLTTRHREALAHLLYGLGEGGGFVQLTGEVGTGKTTICRTLLGQLPEHVDAALIFNPQLTVPELLESICTELHIGPSEGPRSVKVLIDHLYAHLLNANARGRRTVLIVDEAQNLSEEVLEQVRLLTNLETDDAKLLQVFLIGQPELRSILERKALRQLRQRVTARYHLEGLDLEETRHYIRHRLSVAGCDREIFTRRAIGKVYRLSGGIPRRINILCDRALLGAYTTSAKRVGGAVVARAAREIEGEKRAAPRRIARYAMVAVAVMAVAAVGGFVLKPGTLPGLDWVDRASAALGSWSQEQAAEADPTPGEAKAAAASAALVEPVAAVAPPPGSEPLLATQSLHPPERRAEPETPPKPPLTTAALPGPPPPEPIAAEISLSPAAPVPPAPQHLSAGEIIAAVDGDGWLQALLGLSKLWGVPPPSAGSSLCEWARANGLDCYAKPASWADLLAFDLPVVLELDSGRDSAVHVLLFGLSGNQASVLVDGRGHAIARAELEGLWGGNQVLLWRPPPLAGSPAIQLGQRGEWVRWLRDTLASIDGGEASSDQDAAFDAPLLERVKAFQRQRGLDIDGIVGPQTSMHLSLMAAGGDAPSLAAATDAAGRASSETAVAMEAR
jgi:general secretion pathway protein A